MRDLGGVLGLGPSREREGDGNDANGVIKVKEGEFARERSKDVSREEEGVIARGTEETGEMEGEGGCVESGKMETGADEVDGVEVDEGDEGGNVGGGDRDTGVVKLLFL